LPINPKFSINTDVKKALRILIPLFLPQYYRTILTIALRNSIERAAKAGLMPSGRQFPPQEARKKQEILNLRYCLSDLFPHLVDYQQLDEWAGADLNRRHTDFQCDPC